ncbi:hypothetical protein JHK85_009909 [Glycine max]|nr:hypothetical protein JHK85_009909 [Glycine max]
MSDKVSVYDRCRSNTYRSSTPSPRNPRKLQRRFELEIREEKDSTFVEEDGKPRTRRQIARTKKEKPNSVPPSTPSPKSEILQIEEAIAIQGNSSFEERAIVLYKKPPSLNPTDPSLPVQQFILFTLFLHPTSPAMIKLLCRVMVIDMLLFKYIMFPNVGNGHSPRCHESLHSVAWTSF